MLISNKTTQGIASGLQGLKMFDTVQKCEKRTNSPTTSTFIRGSVKSCMYTSIMQDSNIRKLLTDSAQHSVAISKRAYNVSKHAGFISAVWAIDIYCGIREKDCECEDTVSLMRSYKAGKGEGSKTDHKLEKFRRLLLVELEMDDDQ